MEVTAHREHPPIEQVHRGAALALGQGRLQRVGDAAPAVRSHHHPVKHHREIREVDGLRVPGLHLGQIEHPPARLHAGEAALQQAADEGAPVAGRLGGYREADHRARSRMIAQERIGDLIRGVAAGGRAAGGAVHPADLGEEQAEVVV